MSIRQLKKQLFASICSVFLSVSVLLTSTYAWYSKNTQVTATDIQVTASVVYNLLIKRVADGDYSTTCALNGSRTLTPVSTLGELQTSSGSLGINTYDRSDNSYDKNDIRFVTSNVWNGNGVVDTFSEVGKNTLALLTDTSLVTEPSRMYYQDSVYLKAGQHSKIYFDNNSTGIYNAQTETLTSFPDITDPESIALMKTMRVGLMVTQYGTDGTESHKFYVYQLNKDLIDETGASSHTTTKQYNSLEVDGVSYSAGVSGVGIPQFFSLVDGKVPLISDCTANGQSNGLSDVTENSQALALVNGGEEIKVDIYLWMEGCDFDTTASNSLEFSTQIEGIQFGFCLGLPSGYFDTYKQDIVQEYISTNDITARYGNGSSVTSYINRQTEQFSYNDTYTEEENKELFQAYVNGENLFTTWELELWSCSDYKDTIWNRLEEQYSNASAAARSQAWQTIMAVDYYQYRGQTDALEKTKIDIDTAKIEAENILRSDIGA